MREIIAFWIGCLLVVFAAVSARAIPAQVRYQNAADVPLVSVRVCQGAACSTIATTCAAKANCTVVADLKHGAFPTTIAAQGSGTLWSADSNVVPYRAVDPVLCHSDFVCRSDFDASGSVTVADFASFLRVLGSSW